MDIDLIGQLYARRRANPLYVKRYIADFNSGYVSARELVSRFTIDALSSYSSSFTYDAMTRLVTHLTDYKPFARLIDFKYDSKRVQAAAKECNLDVLHELRPRAVHIATYADACDSVKSYLQDINASLLSAEEDVQVLFALIGKQIGTFIVAQRYYAMAQSNVLRALHQAVEDGYAGSAFVAAIMIGQFEFANDLIASYGISLEMVEYTLVYGELDQIRFLLERGVRIQPYYLQWVRPNLHTYLTLIDEIQAK